MDTVEGTAENVLPAGAAANGRDGNTAVPRLRQRRSRIQSPYEAAYRRTTEGALLRKMPQVPWRKALVLSIGWITSQRQMLYYTLSWGIGIGVVNALVQRRNAPVAFVATLLFACCITYLSMFPWRIRLHRRPWHQPISLPWLFLLNGSLAIAMGFLCMFSSLLLSAVLLIGPAEVLQPVVLKAFASASLLGMAIFPLIGLSLALSQEWVRSNTRMKAFAMRMEDHAQNAQLAALRAQINPHFFFNTLNTIAALIPDRPADAERAVELLARAMRPVLADDLPPLVPLSQEMEVAKTYGALEELRFGSRLRLVWDVGPGAEEVDVPTLSLQPLLENAVRYGASATSDDFMIRVRAWRDAAADLEVQILAGPLAHLEQLAGERVVSTAGPEWNLVHFAPGHALHNIRVRLQSLLGAASTLEVVTGPNHVSIAKLRVETDE